MIMWISYMYSISLNKYLKEMFSNVLSWLHISIFRPFTVISISKLCAELLSATRYCFQYRQEQAGAELGKSIQYHNIQGPKSQHPGPSIKITKTWFKPSKHGSFIVTSPSRKMPTWNQNNRRIKLDSPSLVTFFYIYLYLKGARQWAP